MTTKAQAKVILRKVGLRGEWKRTGHPDWVNEPETLEISSLD